MHTITFLQYGNEPEVIDNDYFHTVHEKTGELDGEDEYELTAIAKQGYNADDIFHSVKNFFDFEVFSIQKNNETIATDENYVPLEDLPF